MAKVIVIGAGAVGLASAYHLRKSGHDVTVVDPAPLAAKASGHNAGWLIPSMSTPVPAPGMLLQAAKWMLRPDTPLYVSPQFNLAWASFMARMLRATGRAQFRRGTNALAQLSSGALTAFDELVADGVRFEMHQQPLTMLFTDEHKIEIREHELAQLEGKLPGFTWRRIDPRSAGAGGGSQAGNGSRAATGYANSAVAPPAPGALPALADTVVGAIESRGDRTVDPTSFVQGLAAACEREGVELRLGTAATLEESPGPSLSRGVAPGPRRSGGSRTARVRIGDQLEHPDHVVVAAGAWTNEVLRGIGQSVALQAGKGYGYDFAVEPSAPKTPLYLAEAKVAITPLDTKIRAAGTMGFGGLSERIDTVRAGGIVSGMRRYFTEWPNRTRPVEPWCGLRPMTPDGVPHIGPLRSHPRVLVATGHAMLGVSLAPVTGALIADFVSGAATAEQFPALQPGRFLRK